MNKFKLSILLAAVVLSGCANTGKHFTVKMEETSVICTAKLSTKALGTSADTYYNAKIKRVRVDHNGVIWVRPKSDFTLHWQSGWQKAEIFHDIKCDGFDFEKETQSAINKNWVNGEWK